VVKEWKDVVGYEGVYMVSNTGEVKSLKRLDSLGRVVSEKILKQRKHTGGYMIVNLSSPTGAKTHYIHRIVAESFIDNKDGLPHVNHKDGNKENNSLSNLEWSTVQENIIHAFKNGLNKSPKAMLGKFGKEHNRSKSVLQYLNGNKIAEYGSISEASRNTGVAIASISRCCLGRQVKAGNFNWQFQVV
jgi:NUMOD4 motif/HNH endonuclease